MRSPTSADWFARGREPAGRSLEVGEPGKPKQENPGKHAVEREALESLTGLVPGVRSFLQCFNLATGSVENPVHMAGIGMKLPGSSGIQRNAQFLRSELSMKISQLRR